MRKRRDAGKPLNYQAVVGDDERLAGAARRVFGCWDRALEASGFDPDRIKRPTSRRQPPGTWTPQRVIADIRRDWEAGQDLSAHASQIRHPSLVARARDFFGSWGEALEAAGLPKDGSMRIRRWDPERIRERLVEIHSSGGDLSYLTAEAWDPGLTGAAVRLYGSYDEALKAAGISPEVVHRTATWSRSKVLEAISRGRDDGTIRAVARKLFGSWTKAKEQAGHRVDDQQVKIGNRVKAKRLSLGLSQAELGRRIGRSHRTVGMIEAGQYPDPRVSLALALAEALETTVEDLFGTG